MENEGKTITIQGKQINYGDLSDEKLLKLYQELKQREVLIYQKIAKTLEEVSLKEE